MPSKDLFAKQILGDGSSYHSLEIDPMPGPRPNPTPWLKVDVPRADIIALVAKATFRLPPDLTKKALDVSIQADRIAALATKTQCNGAVCGCPAEQAGFDIHYGDFAAEFDKGVKRYLIARLGLPPILFDAVSPEFKAVVLIARDDLAINAPRVRYLNPSFLAEGTRGLTTSMFDSPSTA